MSKGGVEGEPGPTRKGRGWIIGALLAILLTAVGYTFRGSIRDWCKDGEGVMNFSESLGLSKPEAFTLANGLRVVHVLDRRSPSVVFMVWYHVGSADEKVGKTGLAHFLEHLMFKGTKNIKPGQFAKEVAARGGQLNAFTYYDYTAYYEEISPSGLERMMQMEADRMVDLRLDDDEVRRERDVVLEERRMRIDNDPFMLLYSDVTSRLFTGSSYQNEVIGSFEDISNLQRQDALDFYRSHYAPNNAVIVVVGNVDTERLKELTTRYFGQIRPSAHLAQVERGRIAPVPLQRDEVIERRDERVHNTQFLRLWLAPSPRQAGVTKSLSINLMAEILGSCETGRLYRRLVLDSKIASDVSLDYNDSLMDAGSLVLSVTVLPGVSLGDVEAAVGEVFDGFFWNGPTDEEMRRAKTAVVSQFIYGSDSQMKTAHVYGAALTTGLTLREVEDMPFVVQSIDKKAVQQTASELLKARTVTGVLLPTKEH